MIREALRLIAVGLCGLLTRPAIWWMSALGWATCRLTGPSPQLPTERVDCGVPPEHTAAVVIVGVRLSAPLAKQFAAAGEVAGVSPGYALASLLLREPLQRLAAGDLEVVPPEPVNRLDA